MSKSNSFGSKILRHILLNEDFNYCYESCYLTRRELNPEDYPSTKNPDIFQLILGKGYEIIHYSKKLKESLGVQY